MLSLILGEIEADELIEALALDDGDNDALADNEDEPEELGDTEADGLKEADLEDDGETDALGERDAENGP